MTVLVELSITETLASEKFATYVYVPPTWTVTPIGLVPTEMLPVTVLLVVSNTETLPLPKFEM